MLKIVHISDTHIDSEERIDFKSLKINIPECDVLIHSGDVGSSLKLPDLTKFLIWFESQPAKKKIWIAGNHDLILDVNKHRSCEPVEKLLYEQYYNDARYLIQNYDVVYLENEPYEYEGVKFWGSPFSPSFYRERWVFNADKGEEISKIWDRIPKDTNVLITHTPPYGIMDEHMGEHLGCDDLRIRIKEKLNQLKLHCFGHIHDKYGVSLVNVSKRGRKVLFSNGAVVDNKLKQIVTDPLIITI